jgi:uncharacterized protein HemY
MLDRSTPRDQAALRSRPLRLALLQQAINCDDPDRAARIIQDALGIESDDVVNYCFPTTWPADREQRARYIGEWLKTEARYLGS